MKTIFKYRVELSEGFDFWVPKGAEFLCVQTQRDSAQMWFRVDPNGEKERRSFAVHGTGHDVPGGFYRGTFQMHGGALVFHLFETL